MQVRMAMFHVGMTVIWVASLVMLLVGFVVCSPVLLVRYWIEMCRDEMRRMKEMTEKSKKEEG